MGAFLGPLGGLLEFLHYRDRQAVAQQRIVKYSTSLDGTRTAFLGPRSLGEWSLGNTDLTPEEAAPFELLASGVYGKGPFILIDPLSQVSNVLSRRMSLPGQGNEFAYSTATASSSVSTIPGLGQVPSLQAAGGALVTMAYATPVVAGRPVTVTSYVSGSGTGKIQAQFLDSAGAVLTTRSADFALSTTWKRVSTGQVTPDRAVQVRIRVTATGSFSVALPAVTWTAKVMPYSPGQGSYRVNISGYEKQYEWADPDPEGQRLIDFQLTATEVGNGS